MLSDLETMPDSAVVFPIRMSRGRGLPLPMASTNAVRSLNIEIDRRARMQTRGEPAELVLEHLLRQRVAFTNQCREVFLP